jgi:hypothetical protein
MSTILGDFGTGLVSHWKLDESSGTRTDLKGGNNLTANGTGGVGTANGGADFERADNDYLEIVDASQSGLDFSGDFSFSLWFNLESALSGYANMCLLSKYDFNTPTQAYSLDMSHNSGNNRVRLITSDNGSNNSQMNVDTGFTFSTATWYHLVASFDASASTFELFINGSSEGTAVGAHTSIFNSSAPFRLSGFGVSPVDAPFDGQMKEVSIWSNTKDATDASTLYNSGTPLEYSSASNNNGLLLLGVG